MNPVKRCSLFHVLAGAIALAAGPACAQQVYKWNMPTPYADGSFHTKNTRMFADEVKSASNGRIDITVHSNGSLFKLPEIKRAVQTGQVPIAETNLPAYGNEYAFFDIDGILFLDSGYESAARLWKLSKPYLDKRLNAQGITILYTVPFPGMGMVSKKAITKIEDLKGMKHRSWGPAASRFAELVGATPTVLQASEPPPRLPPSPGITRSSSSTFRLPTPRTPSSSTRPPSRVCPQSYSKSSSRHRPTQKSAAGTGASARARKPRRAWSRRASPFSPRTPPSWPTCARSASGSPRIGKSAPDPTAQPSSRSTWRAGVKSVWQVVASCADC
jgi:hypothetical protein